MEAAMFGEQRELEQEARARIDQQAVELEQHYANGPQNYWQSGCPFVLKAIVLYKNGSESMEGKIIGLPTLEDATAESSRKDCAWVHFTDCTRRWVAWKYLTELRRSPPRPKGGSSSAAPRPAKQMRLSFGQVDGSRSSFVEGGGDDAAPLAAHERDRVMPQKPPAGARGRATSERKTKESKVPINTRLEQNPGQSFRCSAGKLFCAACAFVIPNISANISALVQTSKHSTNLARFNARMQHNLMVSLGEYFRANPDGHSASVDPNDHLFRFRTVETFMHAGVAILKIDMFKPLFMRGGRMLPSATHLRSYIPK
eukprot:7383383-Prymnesium_polylepis.1